MLSVIIPASNEEAYIGACLAALLASPAPEGRADVIVAANGCHDRTAEVARGFAPQAEKGGWRLVVLELAKGGKTRALNAAEAEARGMARAYLDADVIVSPSLMEDLNEALRGDQPRYATGTAHIPRAKSALTRAYARFWQRLPFARSKAPGMGLFAVNAPGRTRWGAFPQIIADDSFVRLQFHPHERLQLHACYDWPMIEGFAALTRVRRRQNAGMAELARAFPGLMDREDKARLTLGALAGLALQDPLGFAAYGAVSLAVKLKRGGAGFTRGR